MSLFMSNRKKYYNELAKINDGKVAIVYKTRKGKNSTLRESAFIVETPRGFAIKMNELMMVRRSFQEKFSDKREGFFDYGPVTEKFKIEEDHILLASEKKISLRRVPFYDSYLWDE